MRPDDFEEAVCDDEHLTSDLALATDEVARSEDERLHLQHEIVQELRLTLLEDRHLNKKMGR